VIRTVKNKKMLRRKFFLKKIAFSLILIFGISFAPNFCHAFWPADWMLNAGLDTILKQIQDMILRTITAALKQAAIQSIQQNVGNAISQGNGSGPMFVTNWEDFLINEPRQKTDLYMNDFFSNITKGRGSSDYSSLSGISGIFGSADTNQKVAGASTMREGVVKAATSSGTLGTNYLSALVQEAKGQTVDASITSCPETDFSSMFSGNSWSSTSSFFGIDTCNKLGTNNIAQGEYLEELSNQEKIAEVQGIAGQGYKSTMSGDTVVTPASTIAAIQAQTQDIGNKTIAAARGTEEVIQGLVQQLLMKTIQQGIGNAGSSAGKSNTMKSNYSSQQLNSSSNPSQMFSPSF
jgi:hypothetical protein